MPREVLKEGQIFLVTDENGDIAALNVEGQGLYYQDTRFLSVYELTVQGEKPQLLSSGGEHNFMTNLQLTNPPLALEDGTPVLPRSISIRRNRFIHDGLHERIGFFNYNTFPVALRVRLTLSSDFRDMFDVRGYKRRARYGEILPPQIDKSSIMLRYVGLDGVQRCTLVTFDSEPTTMEIVTREAQELPPPEMVAGLSAAAADPRAEVPIIAPTAAAIYDLVVPPKQYRAITLHIIPEIRQCQPSKAREPVSLDAEFIYMRDAYRTWEQESTEITTDNEIFNEIVRRAIQDLRLLSDRVPTGFLPSAGIPWFSVPFGRDSIITSLQTLLLRTDIAYGSLRFLAAYQGTKIDDWRDEEPGKILHEIRTGELAALREVPHTPYYGSIDSTPLFLVAVSELVRWTDDWTMVGELLPNIERALEWIDQYGDIDGDGFVEYRSRSERGIRNQGWKDSNDAIQYRDGRLVEPPIALVEVQGYVYDAKRRMSEVFRRLGHLEKAEELASQAQDLKERFHRAFWSETDQFYGLALDARKQLVPAVSSNPGHLLWSGIVDGVQASKIVRRLMAEDMLSGWGIRTLSSLELFFNPMSYHNGSIWPHDNSLIALGMKRQGFDAEATRVLSEVFEAGMRMPGYRLPELYCGFARDPRYFSVPAQYPVSCSPQAWAAGSVFMMLQAMLGLDVNAPDRRISLRPTLPIWLTRISLRRLRVGGQSIDIEVVRTRTGLEVETRHAEGFRVTVEKERVPLPAGR